MTETIPSSSGTRITLKIEGNSLPQLFENTGRALLKTLIDPEVVTVGLREKVVVEAPDGPQLLDGWIKALLNLVYDQRILFKSYRFQEFELERKGAGRLRAEITGELLDPVRHVLRTEGLRWRCERIELINTSKSIEAQIVLVS